ncbi:hypothetical protein [uncultured Clostridium sp.]|jgi:hypothetical protein|uniref:hypothetical protein n=1 Tax=uncultured Clostridium sp. TaxID=59620 RepID=UPI0026378A1C|nr:hypothetical protein [uncultured Clostridium sp.]
MKFTIEKNIRILDELVTYYNKLGNTNVHIDMSEEDNKHHFFISGVVENMSEDELLNLKVLLSTPRQREIEEYYWQLGGEISFDCELTLVGMMIDEAQISYRDSILTIKVMRVD